MAIGGPGLAVGAPWTLRAAPRSWRQRWRGWLSGALTMDEIAARAHAGKGALYRRWPSKAALVADAVLAWREKLGPGRCARRT